MIGLSWDSTRLFLHILAATVWVGGQLTLAALVPALRGAGLDVPKRAAQAFNRIAWPAFAVLLLTGIWNVMVLQDSMQGQYRTTLMVKLVVVAVSGIAAFAHARARTRKAMGVYGALTGLSALLALFLGVLLSS